MNWYTKICSRNQVSFEQLPVDESKIKGGGPFGVTRDPSQSENESSEEGFQWIRSQPLYEQRHQQGLVDNQNKHLQRQQDAERRQQQIQTETQLKEQERERRRMELLQNPRKPKKEWTVYPNMEQAMQEWVHNPQSSVLDLVNRFGIPRTDLLRVIRQRELSRS